MKKTLFVLICCSVFFLNTKRATAQFTDSMEVNTLKTILAADGGILGVQVQDSGMYKNLIYAQSLWMGGFDTNDTLHVSAITFRSGIPGFRPGPISNDPNAHITYNNVYHISLQTISDFVNGNTSGIPAEIANWPAHGNTAMGEAVNLAPFVDINNDGNYDPSQGDYPDIKGDEALFAISNDKNGRGVDGMGVEIHTMAYAYNTGGPEDSIVYLDYKIFNRSNEGYSDVYISSFVDFDLGNSIDDLPGTNVSADAVFCYNGDDNDNGPDGFGAQPASCGLRILKGPPADLFDGMDNDKDGCVDGVLLNGICQPENTASGIREYYKMSSSMAYYHTNSGASINIKDPRDPIHYYNYMRSLWKNGNNLVLENPSGFGNTANGDGYTPDGSGTKTNYIFPGNSYDTTGTYSPPLPNNWFASPSNSADHRALANMGPFSLSPGQSFDINMAIVWSRDSSASAGYTNLNHGLTKLNREQPVRNVSIRNFNPSHKYQLYFDVRLQNWVLHNQSDRNFNFKLVSIDGKLISNLKLEGHSYLQIDKTLLSKGVYLLINKENGLARKIMY